MNVENQGNFEDPQQRENFEDSVDFSDPTGGIDLPYLVEPGIETEPDADGAVEEFTAKLAALDDDLIEKRTESLRAGLADYDLDEEDLELLDADESYDDEHYFLPALPVLAIVGRRNVGKSALVNRILGRREAVVEDTPGVTR